MTFESPESRPAATAPGVQPAGQPVQPVWSAPVRRTGAGVIALASVGLVVGGTAMLLVLVYLATFLGPGALLICLLLALIPLSVILLAVGWIDRWEPEPRPALWFALLWGAGVSVASALIFDLGVQIALNLAGASRPGQGSGADFTAAVIQAPIVEETAKGFGILLIFWVLRRRFDGPVDGIVFAATVAAGFAFSENIQYFGLAMMDGGAANLGFTFLVRGVLSPFAHVMFTACTGIAIGLAARRRGAAAVGTILLGLLGAILLHMLWNGAFYLVDSASLVTYYLLVQVPLFVAAVVVVVLLRRQEKRITERRLSEYAAVGWFSAAEVAMLATPEGRRQARSWAARQPRVRKRAMQNFIRDATRLAFARQRMLNGTAGHVDRTDEAELLALIQTDRAGVIG